MTTVVVLVGTVKGAFFFYSDTARRTWEMTGPHLAGWEVSSLLGDPNQKGRIYAGTGHFVYGPTIRVSEDGGETWEQVEASPQYSAESGYKLNRIWQIVSGHPSQPNTLFAGVDEAGLFVSHDKGQTWSEIMGLTNHHTRSGWEPGNGGLCLHTILIDPNDAKRMWVAISAVGVFRSEDSGETWRVCNQGLPEVITGSAVSEVNRCVHKIVLDPRDPNTLYMQFHGGVFKSTDGADSWVPIEHGLPGNFGFPMVITQAGDIFTLPLESDTHRYFKEGQMRAYRSRDGGEHWESHSDGLPKDVAYVGVLRDAMAADTLDPAGVYFGTSMGEVYYTRSSGEHWERLPGSFSRITTVKSWILE
jgi:photosystem II stability/assembly factor-like uncharacterized protein